jgi:hypothetical protein
VWGELAWLKAIISLFEEYGFDYTYWTYKAVAHHAFPDGIYQAIPNSKFVNRQGPMYGAETYARLWKKEKKELLDFWHTKNFTPNQLIIDTLKSFFTRP